MATLLPIVAALDGAPPYVGNFSAAFAQEAAKGKAAQIYPVIDFYPPASEPVRRWGGRAAQGSIAGYVSKVETFGKISRSVSERLSTLAALEFKPTVVDTDRDFSKLLAKYPVNLRGSKLVCRLASPNVPPDAWYTAFSGILDHPDQVKPLAYQLTGRPNDAIIVNGQVTPPKITKGGLPNADPSVIGSYMPLAYGVFDSTNLGGKGCLPCLLIDNTQGMHLISAGHIVKGLRGFLSGTLNAGATFSYPILGGIQCSVVTISGANSPNTVTVDIQGLDDRGDGTGNVMTNPVQILSHILNVWTGYNPTPYTSGLWPALTGAPLDQLYLGMAQAFCNDLGYEASRYLAPTPNSPVTVTTMINEWLASLAFKGFWRNNGLLAFRPIDHRVLNPDLLYLQEADIFRHQRDDETKNFMNGFDPVNLVSEIDVSSEYDYNLGKYQMTYTMLDSLLKGVTIVTTKNIPWSAARQTGL